jgi:hypothetical protein
MALSASEHEASHVGRALRDACDVDILGLEPAAWRRAGVGGIARIADHAVDDQPVPDKEHEQRAKRGADEASTLIEPIPADSLANERGDERACNSQMVVCRFSASRMASQSWAALNVSQLSIFPDLSPVMNQRVRCCEEPWVKASGTT